jgi:hypothetical protein
MAKSVFRVLDIQNFENYILQTSFQRRITTIQNHHTFKPDYSTFNAVPGRHMMLLENMRNDHIRNRKWSDIGQNLTIFPDGKIGTCRPIDIKPAGIYGANTGGICIEHLGNFDRGKDSMTLPQKEAIVRCNAVLCFKFGLKPVAHQVVYHHWYDGNGKRFADADINSGKVVRNKLQKTCPGTAFFNGAVDSVQGNTIESATANFYPLIDNRINILNTAPSPILQPHSSKVLAPRLNVRSGRGIQFPVIRSVFKNTQILIFESAGDWSRISATSDEWVNNAFIA